MTLTLSFCTRAGEFVVRARPPTGLRALETARTVIGDSSLTAENLTGYIQDTLLGVTGFRLEFPVPVSGRDETYEIRQPRVDLSLTRDTAAQCGTCFDHADQIEVRVPPNGLLCYLTFTPYLMVKNRGTHVGWRADLNVNQAFVDWVSAGCPPSWDPLGDRGRSPVGVWLSDGLSVYKLRETRGGDGHRGVENAVHFTLSGPEATPLLTERIADLLRRDDERSAEQARKEARSAQFEVNASKVRAQHPRADLMFGGHDCEGSPTGQCVYDLDSDGGDDDCLYCHGPNDRQ